MGLRGLGIRPGDRVMIVGENCRAFVTILLASAGMGCVAGAGERRGFRHAKWMEFRGTAVRGECCTPRVFQRRQPITLRDTARCRKREMVSERSLSAH